MTRTRRLFAAWLGVLVLAVNLFGWQGTAPAGDRSATMAGMLMDGMCDMPSMQGAGVKSGNPAQSRDDLLCPACFPLGCAASGALLAPPPLLVIGNGLIVDTLTLPAPARPLSRTTTPYHARGPPTAA